MMMCNHYHHDDMPERTLDEPDPHAHDEPPREYEHEDEDELHHISCNCWQCNAKALEMTKVDPIESGVDLVETLWLIGTGKTLKEWTIK